MKSNGCSESYVHSDRVHDAHSYLVDEEHVARLAEIFRTLGDPTRLRLVSILATAELCVCDLSAVLAMSQSAVSHQLRTLRDLRLVSWRREGRHIFYQLADEHVADLFRRGLEHVGHE